MKAAKALALPVALLILAEIGARLGGPSDSIAPPSAAALALVEALGDGSLLEATRDTLLSAIAQEPDIALRLRERGGKRCGGARVGEVRGDCHMT